MAEESTTPDLEHMTRRSLEAFNHRDFDAALAMYAPDAVWDMSSAGLGVFKGREAIRGLFNDWIGSYEDFEHELQEFSELGNYVTLYSGIQRARPSGSDSWLQLRWATATTWADGLIERVTVYLDVDEARAAAERLAKERG